MELGRAFWRSKWLIHDLKRPQQWMSRLASWLIGMTIPPDFRLHYNNSLRAAYSSHELGAILRGSRFKGWWILEELLDITVGTLSDTAVGERDQTHLGLDPRRTGGPN